MKALYSSPLIPPEWIAAHGWEPVRWQAMPPMGASPAGACPFAWAWMEAVRHEPDARCLILTTECDQMRRGADESALRLQRPVFLFNIPARGEGETADAIYRAELERLGRFLVRQGGSAPDLETLTSSINQFTARRQALLAARDQYTPRAFSDAIAALQRNAPIPPPQSPSPSQSQSSSDSCLLSPDSSSPHSAFRIPHSEDFKSQISNFKSSPLALVGGPLMPHHFGMLEFIARAGGRIVLDATETGELSLAPVPDPALLAFDPLAALTRVYLDRVPTIHRRPNAALYSWLAERLKERAARGILYVYYPWCDPWHAEVERMHQWAPVPLLPLILSADEPFNPSLATRIEAFLETLQ